MPDSADTPRAAAQRCLGHGFHDEALLLRALTHSSRLGAQASAERKLAEANERLEFLGDALLGAAVGLALYRRLPDADEGRLSCLKSNLVSREVLARAFTASPLLAHAQVGGNMGPAAGWPDSVRANLAEAVLAAVFLDGGFDALCTAVAAFLGPAMADPAHAIQDPRQRLLVWGLEHHRTLPTYAAERSGGSDHTPEFTATASINGRSASGHGGSRRRAEAAAAAALLAALAEPAVSG